MSENKTDIGDSISFKGMEPGIDEKDLAESMCPTANKVSADTPDEEQISDDDDGTIFDNEDDGVKKELKDGEISLDDIIMPQEKKDDDIILDLTLPAMMAHSAEEIEYKINDMLNGYSKDEIAAQFKDPNSQLNVLRKILMNISSADNLMRKSLGTMTSKANKYIKDDIRLTDAIPISTSNRKGQVVSGKEAMQLVHAKNRNVRSTFLYNSGVFIILRGPSLDELNEYFNAVHDDTYSFGRDFGAYFHMFSDIEIKRAVTELLKKLVVDCSIKNWKQGNTLLRGLSIKDYNDILWIISTLMYKKGYKHNYTCVKEGCDYTESIDVDLGKIRFVDFDRIPDHCLEFVSSKTKKSLNELAKYRHDLGFETEISIGSNQKAVIQVPTIYDYLEYGDTFIGALMKSIKSDNVNQLHNYIRYNLYKVFIPWIKEIRFYDEDGGIDFRINEIAAMSEALDSVQLENEDFGSEITDLIIKNGLTSIAIPFDKCPKCGTVPTYADDGYIAFDPQKYFFGLVATKLAQS